jgi:hypothetical protein
MERTKGLGAILLSYHAGQHTFTWKYVKNGSTSEGADTVWIDDVEFPIW